MANIHQTIEEIAKERPDLAEQVKRYVKNHSFGLVYEQNLPDAVRLWTKEPKKRELQKVYFVKQIEFANKVGLPISIHSREAFNDTLEILKEHKPLHGGVMHCYSGSVEGLNEIINLGLYIGLDGPVTFTNSKTPKEVAAEVPLEKLVVETDCPYLSPHPLRGTVNEPANISLIIDEIARIRDMSKKHLLDVLYQNSCKLFNL